MEITILDDWISRKINADINRENLESYHLQALRDNLAYLLEHNNFYKQLLKDYTINSLADMAKMPLMAEDDIVDDYFRLFCKSQKDAFRAVSLPSSGTEGRIKRLFFTEKEQNDTIDFFYHGMQTYVSRNERVLILFPGDKPGTVGQLLAEALGKFLAIPIILPWQGDGKEVLAKILALKPQHLLAQPWQILILSQLLMENHQNFFLKSILLSADYTDEALERSLAALWHCPVYQHYGMTEMALGGGVFCRAGQGYHLREADFYWEIIDTENLLPLEDGLWGEIVFTTLKRQLMPLFRYRTGDIGRIRREKCPCGSNLPLLDRLQGRLRQRIKIGELYFSLYDMDKIFYSLLPPLPYEAYFQLKERKCSLLLKIYSFASFEKKVLEDLDDKIRSLPVFLRNSQQILLDLQLVIVKELPGEEFHKKRSMIY